jgi:hypothetical protein
MDCFAEPVIGRAFARPVGSQRRVMRKNQPDGQISQNLSSPLCKNIPLVPSGKSVI